MWIVCITSVRHVLTVNGYGGRQTKENEKSWCFKGWETLVYNYTQNKFLFKDSEGIRYLGGNAVLIERKNKKEKYSVIGMRLE